MSPAEFSQWVFAISRVPMSYPMLTMAVGAAIFALGLYGKIWPPTEVVIAETRETPLQPQRDPDTLYQLGKPVGQVEGVVVDVANGIITFGLVRGAMNLNTDAEFEYRDYKLRIEGTPSEAGQREGPQGRWIERRLFKVVCKIIG
jgi:hypothetical protein